MRRSDVQTFRRIVQVSDQKLEFAWLSRFQFGTVLVKVEHSEKTSSLTHSFQDSLLFVLYLLRQRNRLGKIPLGAYHQAIIVTK